MKAIEKIESKYQKGENAKMRRRLVSICISIVMIAVLLTGCATSTFKEYGTYDNFSAHEADFETIREMVEAQGVATYSIYEFGVNEDVAVAGQPVFRLKKEGVLLSMTSAEVEALNNIILHSPGYAYNKSSYNWIKVTQDYVFIEYEGKACGVLYTNDIDGVMEDMCAKGDQFGYEKLGNQWYGIYR